MSARDVLLDACIVINLAASEVWEEVAVANGHRFLVTRRVADESQYWMRTTSAGEELVQIDLRDFERRGKVAITDLIMDELETFVEFARDVDDGEAETLAVSVHRRLPLVTDDRRAIRFIQQRTLPVEILRTTTIIHGWASSANAPNPQVSTVLRRIERGARFVPPSSDPLAQWWMENLMNQ